MDDFLNVMRTSDRLCTSYVHCNDCPFYQTETGVDVCGMKNEIFEDPEDFLSVINEWAKEHPEMPCDAYNSGVCMVNGNEMCDCSGDAGLCMKRRIDYEC